MFSYYILRFFSFCISQLPITCLPFMAKILAFLSFSVFKIRRKLILDNISTAFSDQDHHFIKKIGKESTYHFALTVLEFLHARKRPLDADIVFEDKQILTEALKEGKGVFLLGGHMSNWESLCCAICNKIASVYPIVKKVGNDHVNSFVVKRREKNGFFALYREKKGDVIKQVSRHLKQGHMVGFMMDQARQGDVDIDFFGKKAKTNSSLAIFWKKYKRPIIPVTIKRLRVGSFKISFKPPVVFEDTKDKEKDLNCNMQVMNHTLENIIKESPEQYFWFHNRWK